DGDGDLLAFEIRRTQELAWIEVINARHCSYTLSCSERRHLIRRRHWRFPWWGTGYEVVNGERPPRHAPSKRPAPALSCFPPSERDCFRRWRWLGEEEILEGKPLRCDTAAENFDSLLPLGFGHRGRHEGAVDGDFDGLAEMRLHFLDEQPDTL